MAKIVDKLQFVASVNKKLSYRRESAHLTLLYRTVQKAMHFDMLNRLGVDHWMTSVTERQTDGQTNRLKLYSAGKRISIKLRA